MYSLFFFPTSVFYPAPPGTYVPIVFIPGVFTLVTAESYATVLANFASYGFVVAGVDLFWPADKREGEFPGPETVFEVIQWVCGVNSGQHIYNNND